MNAYLGVDPGLSGAIAIIIDQPPYSTKIKILPTPVAGKEIDVQAIIDFINLWLPDDPLFGRVNTVAYIEKVGAFPGQGVSSMFKFGFTTGVMHGIIRTLGIPLYTVTPQAWKKEILSGTDKSKQAAIDYCLRAYPDVKLFRTERSKTYDDGLADALCIAEYAKKKHS